MSALDVPAEVDVAGADVHLSGVVHLYPSPEGDVVALRGVDLDIKAGESVALLGPSGAGKSTVLGLLAGEFAPSAGSVRIGEHDLGKLGADALSRLRAHELSLVVQGAATNLLSYATALENVWFAQHGSRRRKKPPARSAMELLELFHVGGLASRRVDEMSMGERQRVALVAGVAVLPRLLLVDEPTSQLSGDERDQVIDTILTIHREIGLTVIVVTHDTQVASRFERTVTIRDGRVGAEGRYGVDYAVVGRDGSLHLPPEVLDLLPPDSLVRVIRLSNGVELRRADEEER
ncbi:MAG TPA: ATP-binding cassette domain-containing protein [Acidimicrobiales bacterium]|nr:ATP-binding cassette domain-containing protein [Acidimicrobiales bacterium]